MNFNIEDYKGKYVMHCKTEEEAKVFCAYLDSIGRTWDTGDSYLSTNYWRTYKKSMCYNFNAGIYCDKEYYKKEKYIILEMEDFMEENKNMDYVDSIFKMLKIKPNEPFIIRDRELKYLCKMSSDLILYINVNKNNSISEEKGEWVICNFISLRSILLDKVKIEKARIVTEEDKKVIEYWKRAGFQYLAKDKDGKVYAYSLKPDKRKQFGIWNIDDSFNGCVAKTYAKCDFLSWEDDEPYCFD